MPDYENIDGAKRIAYFEALIEDRTFVQVSLPGGDYDQLTVVTEIIEAGEQRSFRINSPKGLQQAVAQAQASELLFEFTSDDRVTHRFSAAILGLSRDNVQCELPQFIERHQQRDNFRVKALYECRAAVSIDDQRIQMDIDNISLGGVYCYCDKKFKPLFKENAKLQDMELSVTMRDDCFLIPIQRVQVRRLESRYRPRLFGIAFEFIRIDKEARRQLVQRIYDLQREFLKNRLKVAG